MTTVAAAHTVLPRHCYPQAQLTDAFVDLCLPGAGPTRAAAARRLHGNAGVALRHLALPIERYARLGDFSAANQAYIAEATELGSEAVSGALERAGLRPERVDLIVFTTGTGIAVPSIDSRIATRIGLRPDVKRVPLFGLGCLGGAAGIARVHDFLRGDPDAVAVLVAVELCSLTIQRTDSSVANLVASGLFGDGAAAVVLTGERHGAGPRVVDSVSHQYPDTVRAMGWDVSATGLKVVLGAEVPTLVATYLADDVNTLLGRNGLGVEQVSRWVCHPGGPKVITAIQTALGLDADDLAITWRSLHAVGNLSSASVLFVLHETLARRPAAGQWGVLMALGPGFAAELVLLQW
jgi:alkylresorcinol/alkylpyrone synthase